MLPSDRGRRRSCKEERPREHGPRCEVAPLAFVCLLLWPAPGSASLDGLHVRRATACDGSEMSLRCPADTVVDVMNAFYGRIQPSSVICPYLHTLQSLPPLFSEDTQCELAVARSVVKQRCQDRRSCAFKVASRTFGADPCPVTGKYLLVSYRCMPVKFIGSLSCEGNTVDLQCERSKRLFVNGVFYGWSAAIPSKCQLISTSQLSDVSACNSASASFEVKRRCSGRRTCLFEVADTVLGHACPGRHKYLDISYVCVPKGILVSSWRGPNATELSAAAHHTHTSQNDHPGAITSAVFRPLSGGSTDAELPKVAAVLDGHALTGSAERHGVMLASVAPAPNQVTGTGSVGLAASSAKALCNETELLHANHRHGSAYGDDDLMMGWVHTIKYIQDNTEKMVLYGTLCGCLALLLAMLLAIGRLLHMRRQRRGRACGGRHRHLLARGVHHCRAEDVDEDYDDDDSDRRKLNVSSNGGPPSADQSNEENTYVPAADPSDIAGLTAFGLSLAAGSSGLGGGSSRSDDVFHRHDPRHTYYENDDGTGGGVGSATGGDRTCTNSFYDRHS